MFIRMEKILEIILDKNYNNTVEGCSRQQCYKFRMVEMVLALIFCGGWLCVWTGSRYHHAPILG